MRICNGQIIVDADESRKLELPLPVVSLAAHAAENQRGYSVENLHSQQLFDVFSDKSVNKLVVRDNVHDSVRFKNVIHIIQPCVFIGNNFELVLLLSRLDFRDIRLNDEF